MPHFNGKPDRLSKTGKVCRKGGKMMKCDIANHYDHLDPNINPDHPAMKRGKEFNVDKDIDRDKKMDPKKIFENYKENKKPQEINKKKIRSVKKNNTNNINAKKGTLYKL
tara:strand:- start:69 stop:398 length:330 start_codon:yes stop_codon:yes gene_type:complete